MRINITEDRTAAFFDIDLSSHFSGTLIPFYQSSRCHKLKHFINVHTCVYVCVMFHLVFLGLFATLQRANIIFFMSDRPSAKYSSASIGGIFMKFGIYAFFKKSVEKIQFSLKSDKYNRYFTRRPIYIHGSISLSSS